MISQTRRRLGAVAAAYLSAAACFAAGGAVTTVAGGGSGSDGGPAITARLAAPKFVAVAEDGTIFFSDEAMDRIRKIMTSGLIGAVAGQGGAGDFGDGGPAVKALLNVPHAVALDAQGRIYISDSGNHRVRRIDQSGSIVTIAGNGQGGYSGDGGPARLAMLFSPKGVTIDADGVVYISDTGNHRIRRVGTDGTITTIAGNGEGGFSGDGGRATEARLAEPQGILLDPAGNLILADWAAHRVRRIDPSGIITTVAGNGTESSAGDGRKATLAAIQEPSDVALDLQGTLFIADENAGRIRKVDSTGRISTLLGPLPGDNSTSPISWPTGVALDSQGNLLIADSCSGYIRKFEAAGAAPYFSYRAHRLLPGDLNGDGLVTIQDAILLLRSLVGDVSLTVTQGGAADLNGDGRIDVLDAHLLLQRIAGL